MRQLRRWTMVAGMTAVLLFGGIFSGMFVRPAHAQGLRSLLLLGGIVLVVSSFGGQINDVINNALGQRQAAAAGATKVVPIFSVGRGTYVGAAQVVGVPDNVQRTRGVAALNVSIGNLSGTALFPIGTTRPSGGSISRVNGVGVSAVIDFRL